MYTSGDEPEPPQIEALEAQFPLVRIRLADNKRLGAFKQADAKPDATGKSMTITPKWLDKAPPLAGEPALLLTPQPRRALRAELSDAKMAE